MSTFGTLLRGLLRLAPASFRHRYGEEYLSVAERRMRGARGRGRVAGLRAGFRELAGGLRAVARMRLGLERPERMRRRKRGGGTMLSIIGQDTGQALRALRRNSGFTAAAVLVIGLGIGANAAIFSAVNAFFFRPLPFADPDRLVLLYETNPEFEWTDTTAVAAAPANALDWRDRVEAFSDVAVYRELGVGDVAIQTGGDPILVGGTTVSGNFFDVLGVPAQLGRTFTWDETWSGNDAVVVLGHGLWVSAFGADPDVIGTTIPFGGAGTPHEIIGVMPEGFAFPNDRTQLWYTYAWEPSAREEVWFRRAHFVRPVARLAPGVGMAEADAQLQSVVRALQEEYPETNRVMGAELVPLRDFLVREVKTPLMVLVGAVAILLLLACANVANLMLVRASDRSREVALRNALGAGRRRVAGQLLIESLLIGVAGGALGLALGWFGVRAMTSMTRLGIEGATDLALDGRVVAFTLGIAVLSAVLFGTFPAVRSAMGDVHDALRDGGRGQSRGRRGIRATGILVATEVALALLLVVGAGLMIRSAYLLRSVDPGFALDGALAVELSIPSSRYPDRDQVLAFWDELEWRLEGRSGIERAGMVGALPLAGPSWSSQFQAEGWPPDRVGFEILHRRADKGYFEALDIPLVRGRLFEPGEGPDEPRVVVVNESFAREYFPNEDPIGQRIAYDRAATEESTWWEVVGVVGDQHQESPGVPARAEVFENRNQDWGRDGWIVMKTSVDPLSVVPAVRGALAEMDPQIPLASVRPLRDVWTASMNRERFLLVLLGVFGASALLLASVGIYGVTAQATRRRTQEIGIRMALGADTGSIRHMVLRYATAITVPGIALGVLGAWIASRWLDALLYGVEATSPGAYGASAVLFLTLALASGWLPARRATRVDTVRALTAE